MEHRANDTKMTCYSVLNRSSPPKAVTGLEKSGNVRIKGSIRLRCYLNRLISFRLLRSLLHFSVFHCPLMKNARVSDWISINGHIFLHADSVVQWWRFWLQIRRLRVRITLGSAYMFVLISVSIEKNVKEELKGHKAWNNSKTLPLLILDRRTRLMACSK